ncbi:glutamyl-tRNA reductase [Litorihabitans aurantiacus]|uniref:Glutamyl-tRNA reductase n=1 Tax=Litorihabitans aurantiacus TaxID=1930061 RepID=A0AA37XD63_9MICO|nr:glutamyl-tRNA reductase [Litorihabitans aurantiacus]GMA31231.1 glutamyl-tRNA reductase [Litorihabitans aurantiacus]
MLLSLSLTHATAGFDVLERMTAAFASLRTPDLIAGAMERGEVAGAVVLSTCNRLEAYLDVEPASGDDVTARLVTALASRTGEDPARLLDSVAVRSESDAVNHLFSVACGLDSLVVGEPEIAGQVRRDYDAARVAGFTTTALDQAFQRAMHVSRDVRRRSPGTNDASVTQLALELAAGHLTDLRTARVLLVGTGAHARTAVAALAGRGVHDVAVYSASGRAEAFAARHGVRALAAADTLADGIAHADVVLTCTGRVAIGEHDVAARAHGRLLVIDLGLPRNVDPAVGALVGVDLLDLATIAKHARLPGLTSDAISSGLVADAVSEFTAQQDASNAVVALRSHVGGVLDAEIARARRRATSEQEADRIEEALRHLAGVLQHTPSVRARQAAADGRVTEFEQALEVVLGVEVAASSDQPPLRRPPPPRRERFADPPREVCRPSKQLLAPHPGGSGRVTPMVSACRLHAISPRSSHCGPSAAPASPGSRDPGSSGGPAESPSWPSRRWSSSSFARGQSDVDDGRR